METAIIKGQGARSHMEDFHILNKNYPEGIFATICDGHGGEFAARYMTENIFEYFHHELNAGIKIEKAFGMVYEKISQEIIAQNLFVGTTAVSFLLKKNEVYFANAGDSHLMVIGEKKYRRLTREDRVSNSKEKQRILQLGGLIEGHYVCTEGECLMMTRSIGDSLFKKVGVIATPHFGNYQFTENDFLLVAGSDGLFDTISRKEIANLARGYRDINVFLSAISNILKHRYGHGDNYCVIAISL